MPQRRIRIQRKIQVTVRRTVRQQVVVRPVRATPAPISGSVNTRSVTTRSVPALGTGAPAVRQVAENLGALIGDAPRDFDVFVSHASEDKDAIVRPLAEALRDAGLDVWFDEFELRVGDSLRRKIDAGIARARFGIVVLSHAFFAKQWTQYELDGIVTAQVTGKQIVLPLWHGVDRDDVFSFSPSLADKVALDTSVRSIAEIAADVVAVVGGPPGGTT